MVYALKVTPSIRQGKCVKRISKLIVAPAHRMVNMHLYTGCTSAFVLSYVLIFPGIQHIPNPDNCRMYYRCVNGVRTSMTCPAELLFDRNFGDCNIAFRVQCEQKNTICEPFSSLGLITIGNPSDCSRLV